MPTRFPRPTITRQEYERAFDLADRFSTAIVMDIQNENEQQYLRSVFRIYDYGDYESALAGLNAIVRRNPSAINAIWPYLEICERVAHVPPHPNDASEAKAFERWLWAKRTMPNAIFRRLFGEHAKFIRCKYCLRYTAYVGPNDSYAYLSDNNCKHCKRGYPMPSFYWDSIVGQAYMYYRGSVNEQVFYDEFEIKCDVQDIAESSGRGQEIEHERTALRNAEWLAGFAEREAQRKRDRMVFGERVTVRQKEGEEICFEIAYCSPDLHVTDTDGSSWLEQFGVAVKGEEYIVIDSKRVLVRDPDRRARIFERSNLSTTLPNLREWLPDS